MLAYHNERFINSEHGRSVRIMSEFLASKAILDDNKIDKTIVIFGSARIKPENKYYQAANSLALKLGEWAKNQKEKYAICTGGGPGIMEAGNKGAKEANAQSLGFCIELPFEQSTNPYVDKNLEIQFHYFFLRKFWFLSKSAAIIAFPGGWGTFDELFESLTMLQNNKTNSVPLVLFGTEFWKNTVNWQRLIDDGLIDEADMNFIHFSDDVDECVKTITQRVCSAAS
ncbi:MAG: TIGR00730 family Rossman fold protein [Fibromonadaceae bacterium]|nr:TIGR00730 family Rossman fold protein [Fibromonadaceae bacterium]